MKLPPSDVAVGGRVRVDIDDGIDQLRESIQVLGQLQPIGVDRDLNLLYGRRRLRACELLGINVWVETVTTLDDVASRLKAERDENTCRKDFTPSEAVELGKRLEALEKPKSEERKAAGVNQYSEPASKLDEASKGRTDEKVAAAVGLGKDTYRKAKAVVENGTPELVEAMDRRDISIDRASKVAKLPVVEQVKVAKIAGEQKRSAKTKQKRSAKTKSKADPLNWSQMFRQIDLIEINARCGTKNAIWELKKAKSKNLPRPEQSIVDELNRQLERAKSFLTKLQKVIKGRMEKHQPTGN